MKSKICVLVVSIIVAVLVIGIGIFGMQQAKKSDKKNAKKEVKESSQQLENDATDSSENITEENGETEESKETENNSESSSAEEATSQPETTTPQAGGNPVDNTNSSIDPTKPMVALTFDDGPSRENTTKILDALKNYNAHATFFVVGYNIDGNEDILQRITNEGSEVGSHTASHCKITTLDANGIASEIDGMAERIKGITGQQSVILRPPYGSVDDNVMANLKDPVILWSIDTEDWKTRDVQSTVQNIQNSVYDGAIILMHDLYGETADAAVQIIDWLHSQGYQMVTVSELGWFRRGGLQSGIKYGSLKPN